MGFILLPRQLIQAQDQVTAAGTVIISRHGGGFGDTVPDGIKGWHDDVYPINAILVIAFPPCQYLCGASYANPNPVGKGRSSLTGRGQRVNDGKNRRLYRANDSDDLTAEPE